DSPVMRFHDANGDGDCLDAADNIRYYAGDANFNVTATIDAATGAVIERYVYTAYGTPAVYSATWTSPAAPTTDGPLYCGYFFDAETGLYQVRNRYYDDGLSTFVSRDPIGHDVGYWNLYLYAACSPLSRVDPAGLFWTRINDGDGIGYPVDLKDGLTPDERNAACTAALKTIPASIRDKVGGFVTCSKGKYVICVNPKRHPTHPGKDENLTPEQNAANVIHRCKVDHEKTHVPDLEKCDEQNECTVLDMKYPNDVLEKRKSECRAIQAEVNCVRSAKAILPYPSPRQKDNQEYLDRLEHQIKVLKATAEVRAQCKSLGMDIK
ncbi:MAG: RHS repeat-associated core domain-containing protein, partial [Planctomycetaceae bacterium]|nr:RHS repeat-associated core domain-containing protein [Planctomycetaceae bacterium]